MTKEKENPAQEPDQVEKGTKTESLKKSIELKYFGMDKVKVMDGGVNVSFFEMDNENRPHQIESKSIPHPDLMDKMNGLRLYVADCLGLLDGWDFARDNLRDLSKPDLLKEAMKRHIETIENVRITGFSFTGSGDNQGIRITYYLKCKTGGFGSATPNIAFSGTKLGTEDVIKEIAEEVKKEVWLHFFKNKKGQPDLLDQIEEAEGEESKPKSKPKGRQMKITDPEAVI